MKRTVINLHEIIEAGRGRALRVGVPHCHIYYREIALRTPIRILDEKSLTYTPMVLAPRPYGTVAARHPHGTRLAPRYITW